MPTHRALGSALFLVVLGVCLVVLSGCSSDTAESIAESEGEPREVVPTMPDSEPEGTESEGDEEVPEPGVAGEESEPDLPLAAPESPAGVGGPSAPPGSTVPPEGALPPRDSYPRVTASRPSPMQPAPVERIDRMARPDEDAAREGPVLLAPGNVSEASDASGAPPRPRMMESPGPMATPPPPMAVPPPPTAALEPAPIAARSEEGPPAAGTEPTGPPAAAEAPDARPGEGISGAEAGDGGYEVVSVFYGTDRAPMEVAEFERRAYLGWLYLTAFCAVITLILIVMAYRRKRLPVLLLAGAGVAATLLFGAITALRRFPGEPVGPRPDWTYGSERGELEMGTCKVSIPEDHQKGEIERPSVFRLEVREDPREHIVLLELEEQPPDTFFANLRDRVQASPKKEAFVFVHGFNTTFDEAAYRTAQLAYDLEFQGAPIFFSWPSQGGLLAYSRDEDLVAWAVPHLKDFLIGVAQHSGADAVHLIAHSMGNRALTSALQSLSYELGDKPPMFRELVLTAPDIDAEIFRRDIVPAIVNTADRVTLYASSNDEALKLSKAIHGYRRAGDSDELLVIDGVDTVDVSAVDTSLLGHEYYGNNQTVIADMLDLINESKPPNLRRFLEPRPMGELFYWVFRGEPRMLGSQPPEAAPRR